MAFHLEINGLSKNNNHKIEKYFYSFVTYWEDDKSRKIAMAKFSANNNKLRSIKIFLFFAIKGLHLYISFNKVEFSDADTCKQIPN